MILVQRPELKISNGPMRLWKLMAVVRAAGSSICGQKVRNRHFFSVLSVFAIGSRDSIE